MKNKIVSAQFEIGKQFLREKEFTKAVDAFTRVVEMDNKHWGAYANLGIALKNLGMYDEALVAYKHADKLKPKQAEIYNNIGNIYTHNGDFDKAKKYYEDAINLKPGYIDAYRNLAEINFQQIKPEKGKEIDIEGNKIIRKKEKGFKI